MKKNLEKRAIELHKKNKGKIEIKNKISLTKDDNLSLAYTPGVGAVCMEIARDKKKSFELTNRSNSVAIVSDGTAVLGLGNIGPEAGMPVMEGKSAIFKAFADIDAFPLCIKNTDTKKIIEFCKNIEPSFSGINLEDISAPRCFEITEALEEELDIPVFHDDQDGTAIVSLAALINACRVENRVLKELKIVINGAGAAGIATARLFLAQGVKDLTLLDSKGIVGKNRKDLNKFKKKIAKISNKENKQGGLKEAIKDADVFVGLSKAGVLSSDMVRSMNEKPIIFAMANPSPEIMPDEAIEAGASIVGTGRSDFPNQINNALVFPGIFKGLLDGKIKKVNQKMKISVAIALAYSIKPSKNKILPPVKSKKVVKAIAETVKNYSKVGE